VYWDQGTAKAAARFSSLLMITDIAASEKCVGCVEKFSVFFIHPKIWWRRKFPPFLLTLYHASWKWVDIDAKILLRYF